MRLSCSRNKFESQFFFHIASTLIVSDELICLDVTLRRTRDEDGIFPSKYSTMRPRIPDFHRQTERFAVCSLWLAGSSDDFFAEVKWPSIEYPLVMTYLVRQTCAGSCNNRTTVFRFHGKV